MMYLPYKPLGKICAIFATTLILPVLAYADHQDGNSQGDDNNSQGHKDQIPVVPEANPAWVLVPFVGAVLLYSWRQLSRAKA